MSPIKNSRTKATESQKPKKVSGSRKQRKFPKLLAGIERGMLQYGVRWADFTNGNATQTAIYPPAAAASSSNTPMSSHVTISSQESASEFAEFIHPQIPVSAPIPGYLDNTTRDTMYCGTEPTTSSHQSQSLFQTELDGWQTDEANILSMADNPHQSYGNVTNLQGAHDLIFPPRSLGFDDDLSQHFLSDPDAQYSSPQPYEPYMPTTFLPTDMPRYIETSAGSFYLTMTLNDGTHLPVGPFPNDDARNNHLPYIG